MPLFANPDSATRTAGWSESSVHALERFGSHLTYRTAVGWMGSLQPQDRRVPSNPRYADVRPQVNRYDGMPIHGEVHKRHAPAVTVDGGRGCSRVRQVRGGTRLVLTSRLMRSRSRWILR